VDIDGVDSLDVTCGLFEVVDFSVETETGGCWGPVTTLLVAVELPLILQLFMQ
jgi:hypothetical protein